MKKCKFCFEEIQDEAIKCRFCKEILEQQTPLKMSIDYRRCLECGYVGTMEKWSHYMSSRFLILLGLLFAYIPGIAIMIWAKGKYKCSSCSSVKNTRG